MGIANGQAARRTATMSQTKPDDIARLIGLLETMMPDIWRNIRLIGYRDAAMNIVAGLVCGILGGGWILFR